MTDIQGRLTTSLVDRYRIERELGQGGMATVYLAHDVRHDRKVALKVLRPELAAILGGERFLKEIRTTANLQHPHILALHDSGEAEGLVYYVMPYVEGESLRDRLNREKQLPVDEAVRIAREVAGALDYAHRHGVVHRDIKPENILLHDGSATVADFGIALAASRSDGGTRMTETGMSLGTPHYMAPEQAMGEKEITPKADIYALGCVLYESLAGEPPFNGPTAQAIVARVMTEQPRSLTMQRHTIPPHVQAAVETALEKLPADRWASAAEFAEALAGERAPTHRRTAAERTARPAGRLTARRGIAAAGWILAIVAALGWLWTVRGARQRTTWQYVMFGDSITPAFVSPSLALSPDGQTLVFRELVLNGRLWVKRKDELRASPIIGTERATNPVFSPDGEWVAFTQDGQLKKVRPLSGGPVTITDSVSNTGGYGGAAWLDDNTLIYVPPSLSALRRVSAAGASLGIAMVDTVIAGGGVGQPVALPGARGVLFQVCTSGCVTMSQHVLDLRTGKQKLLFADVAQAWYLPTGHLLYVRRDGVGLVAPFDLARLDVTGPAVPVLDGVLVINGFAQLAWSRSGTLIYVRGGIGSTENTIVRVSRIGAIEPADTAWIGQFNAISPSPDGRRLAVGAGAALGALNIWIKQLPAGPFTRLTFSGRDRRPAWSPDGKLVAFVRDTANTGIVVARPPDGSGGDRVLVRLDRQIQQVAWTHDGRWLLVRTDNSVRGAGDIVGVRTTGDTTPVAMAHSPFTELHPSPSPDGRWLAYASDESGRFEIYVRPFPNADAARWQVSTSGGTQPVWSATSRELYYLSPDGRLVAVQVSGGANAFTASSPQPLFDASGFTTDPFHRGYDLAPDGRFLFISPRQTRALNRAAPIIQAENWFADVRSRLRQ